MQKWIPVLNSFDEKKLYLNLFGPISPQVILITEIAPQKLSVSLERTHTHDKSWSPQCYWARNYRVI